MKSLHERVLADVFAERDRILSRRSLLGAGAKLGLGGAAAVALAGTGLSRAGFGPATAYAATTFETDVDVLNYALTLEHLEFAFYRDNVGSYALGADAFGNDIATYLGAVRDHEGAHVDTLTKVITDLKGTPVEEAAYDFGVTDAKSFLATAAALENTGVSAYDGAGQFIKDPGLLTAAGSIVAVEARHASYLNLITGAKPFPEAFETAKSPDEILKIAGPFIKG